MPAPTGVTCESLDSQFSKESGRLSPRIHRLGLYTDPYHRLVKQDVWPDNMGIIVTNSIAQRTIPSGSGWVNVGESDSDASPTALNACLPPVKKISYAVDRKQFQLQHQALESDPLCLEDIRISAFPEEEINSYFRTMAENVNREWTKRYDDDYFSACEHKVIVAPGLPEDDSDFPAVEPTSPLTIGSLQSAYEILTMDNAGEDGDVVSDNGAPVFNVLASPATINNIIKLNEENRQDVRWSSRSDELLGPLGFMRPKWSYGGFVFHSRNFTKRFNDDGNGGFVEVPEYITTAATKGTKAVLNPAYLTAKYDSSCIFHPKVANWLVPGQITKVGETTFGPQNYRGDFKWHNKYDRTCNPDENTGYFRAKMSVARKLIFPQWGFYFLHLRCDLANDLVACPSS